MCMLFFSQQLAYDSFIQENMFPFILKLFDFDSRLLYCLLVLNVNNNIEISEKLVQHLHFNA